MFQKHVGFDSEILYCSQRQIECCCKSLSMVLQEVVDANRCVWEESLLAVWNTAALYRCLWPKTLSLNKCLTKRMFRVVCNFLDFMKNPSLYHNLLMYSPEQNQPSLWGCLTFSISWFWWEERWQKDDTQQQTYRRYVASFCKLWRTSAPSRSSVFYGRWFQSSLLSSWAPRHLNSSISSTYFHDGNRVPPKTCFSWHLQ